MGAARDRVMLRRGGIARSMVAWSTPTPPDATLTPLPRLCAAVTFSDPIRSAAAVLHSLCGSRWDHLRSPLGAASRGHETASHSHWDCSSSPSRSLVTHSLPPLRLFARDGPLRRARAVSNRHCMVGHLLALGFGCLPNRATPVLSAVASLALVSPAQPSSVRLHSRGDDAETRRR